MNFFWSEFLNLSTLAMSCVAGLMLLLWLLHFPLRNAAIVDAGWAAGIGLCAGIYCWYGPGYTPRRWLIALMVVFWAIRLASHLLFNRILGHPEEGRYVELRRQWGSGIAWKFLLFYLAQGVTCVVLSLPFLIACLNDNPNLQPLEKFAALLWVIAKSGETLADLQLDRFKKDPNHRGKVCRDGLWAWSRHPNYFFEWLIWVSYAVYALASPWGWIGLLSPALILHFVLNVTGIPPTEEQALRSRGEAYARYQKEVSAFFPLPPKVAAVSSDSGESL
jgi:steroid 5-alpha reductase family enzyme